LVNPQKNNYVLEEFHKSTTEDTAGTWIKECTLAGLIGKCIYILEVYQLTLGI